MERGDYTKIRLCYGKYNKVIIFLIVGLLIGYSIGYGLGVAWALNWSVDKAMGLMARQGIEIKFNKDMITKALWQYQNNINGCLFTEVNNASIRFNEGN